MIYNNSNCIKTKLVEAELRIYWSVNYAIIGLAPAWGQAIIYTSAGISLIEPLWTHFSKIWIKTKFFIWENEFENVHCKMAAILPDLNM